MSTSAEEHAGTFRPLAFLLKAGAIAGAIGSITGVVFTFAPQLKPGGAEAAVTRVSAPIPGTNDNATLAVASDAVRHLSYRQYLRELGVKPKYATGDLAQKGIVIDYKLDFPGYPKGTKFRIHYDLYRGDTLVRREEHLIHMDRDSDSCACTSSFIAFPKRDAIYRVLIAAYQPGAPFSDPVVKAPTYPFSKTL